MKTLVGSWTRMRRWAAGCVAVVVLAGCAENPHPLAPPLAATPDYTYIVGPGDSLHIIVWRNPELSLTVPVRPDGKFSTPLVDELVAHGKTPVAIAREVEKQLEKYIRDPVVTVIVTGFVGPFDQQIRVIGEAAKPQALPFKQYMTVLDVMIAVGGLTDFADGNNALIVRGAAPGKSVESLQQYTVRLRDLVRRGDVSANVEMKPGDILIIPQSFF